MISRNWKLPFDLIQKITNYLIIVCLDESFYLIIFLYIIETLSCVCVCDCMYVCMCVCQTLLGTRTRMKKNRKIKSLHKNIAYVTNCYFSIIKKLCKYVQLHKSKKRFVVPHVFFLK